MLQTTEKTDVSVIEKTDVKHQKIDVRSPYNKHYADMQSAKAAPPVTEEKIRNADIVPDEEQTILISLRDNIRNSCFAIGDVANMLTRKSAERGLPVTQQRVFDAVGSFCGKSGRTVRYYAETAAFYDNTVREEYDILPFAFFVYARSFGFSKCFDVLEYAMEHPNITLGALRAHFTSINEERLPSFDDGLIGGSEPTRIVNTSDLRTSVFISNVSEMIDSLEKLLDEIEIPDETRENIMCGISTIRDSMPDVVAAAKSFSS